MYTVLTVYDRIRVYTTVYWFITSYISFALSDQADSSWGAGV